jgi:hypothetical protein
MSEKQQNEIDELMEAANCYALGKIEQVISGDLTDLVREGSLVKAGFRLVNQYLFPNLNLGEIEALNTLSQTRRVCAAAVNTPREGMDSDQARRHEHKTRASEKAFMRARSGVIQSSMIGKLTPLQLDVLKREFFEVPFFS